MVANRPLDGQGPPLPAILLPGPAGDRFEAALRGNQLAAAGLPVGHPQKLAILRCHRHLAIRGNKYWPRLLCGQERLCEHCRRHYCNYWYRRWWGAVAASSPCRVVHAMYSPLATQRMEDACRAAERLCHVAESFQHRVRNNRLRSREIYRSLVAMHASAHADRYGGTPLPHLHFFVVCRPRDALPEIEDFIYYSALRHESALIGYTKCISVLHIRKTLTVKQQETNRRHYALPTAAAAQAAYVASPFGAESDPRLRAACAAVLPRRRLWVSGLPSKDAIARNARRFRFNPEQHPGHRYATRLPGQPWQFSSPQQAYALASQLLQLSVSDFQEEEPDE